MQKLLVFLLAGAIFALPALAGCSRKYHPDGTPLPDTEPRDSAATTSHWQKARAYQSNMRYELARQEYLLALATCRTDQTKNRLQRELQIVEMQLRTLR